MKYTIRPHRESDFLQIIDLFREFAVFQQTPDKMTNSVEQMTLEKDHFHSFVVENEVGKLIGYATWFITYHTWVGKSLYMDDLYVVESHRRHGLGKALIDKIFEQAKIENCNRVRWQVSKWNKNAQEFYKSMGASIDDVELNCDFDKAAIEAL